MGTQDYAYVAWINSLLQNGSGENGSMLSRQIYFPGEKFDEFDVTKNPSFKKRLALANRGKSFEMIGQPMHGIFQISKFLPPGSTFNIHLIRSNPGFHLSGPEVKTSAGVVSQPYLLSLDAAEFYVRKIEVNPKIRSEILFKKMKGFFTIRRIQCKASLYSSKINLLYEEWHDWRGGIIYSKAGLHWNYHVDGIQWAGPQISIQLQTAWIVHPQVDIQRLANRIPANEHEWCRERHWLWKVSGWKHTIYFRFAIPLPKRIQC